jgi:sulfate/thiosulfate transport system substrate-binding protein
MRKLLGAHGDWILLLGVLVGAVATGCEKVENKSTAAGSGDAAAPVSSEPVKLLNVSYDPTRELWREVNEAFIADYAKRGGAVTVEQSHGGSSSQARTVIDGLEADVVTLAMQTDTEAIVKSGLINEDWEERLPNNSLPYSSTIVFVVRKGNPKEIKDWKDLVNAGVEVITPNPKTSGNGKLSFLAAWGSVLTGGGSEDQAKAFVTELYKHVPVLDSGARGATTTFAQKNIGDVHLTWENEAYFEVDEAKGELEIVYPATSIIAEPRVAVVDEVVDRKGSRAAAEAYLKFLYTPAAQAIIAKHHYRPTSPELLAKLTGAAATIKLFPITTVAGSWAEAEKKFFASEAIFDSIYSQNAGAGK